MLSSVIDILRHDLRALGQPPLLRRVVLFYPALLAAVIVLAWPSARPVGGEAAGVTFRWWMYVNTYLLGQVVLLFAAQGVKGADEILPHHWVQYAQAPPAAVLAAKLAGGLTAGALWLCISLPAGVMTVWTGPRHLPLAALYGYWLTLTMPLSFVGTWLGSTFGEWRLRAWAVRVFWPTVLLAMKLWTSDSASPRSALTPWSPLSTVEALVPPDAVTASAGVLVQAGVRMLLLGAASAALAFAALRPWMTAGPPAAPPQA